MRSPRHSRYLLAGDFGAATRHARRVRWHRALRRVVYLGVAHHLLVCRKHRPLPFSELFRLHADGCHRVRRHRLVSGTLDKCVPQQPHLRLDGHWLLDGLQQQLGLRRRCRMHQRNLRVGRPGQRHELHERDAMPEHPLR